VAICSIELYIDYVKRFAINQLNLEQSYFT